MLDDLEPHRIAPGIASALATALSGQLSVTRTANLFPGAFFPTLYGGTFAGMTSAFGLSDSGSGRSATLTGVLTIALSIVCGLAFFVVARLDARSGADQGPSRLWLPSCSSFWAVSWARMRAFFMASKPARSPLSRKQPVRPSSRASAGLLRLCCAQATARCSLQRRERQIEYLSHQRWRSLV